jgi:hypothetical protein
MHYKANLSLPISLSLATYRAQPAPLLLLIHFSPVLAKGIRKQHPDTNILPQEG